MMVSTRAIIVITLAIAAALIFVGKNARAQNNDPFSGMRSMTISMTRVQTGWATWYGSESGNRTASGERFNPEGDTCAMRSYRPGQRRTVTVTVISTGRSADCRINDHGPAAHTGNLIDVSHGIGRKLGMIGAGRVKVTVE